MAIGVPGCPELACWTASIASVRMVLMLRVSRSGTVNMPGPSPRVSAFGVVRRERSSRATIGFGPAEPLCSFGRRLGQDHRLCPRGGLSRDLAAAGQGFCACAERNRLSACRQAFPDDFRDPFGITPDPVD